MVNEIILVVTGTQHGKNIIQQTLFNNLISKINIKKLVHGDCIGCDEEAHILLKDKCFVEIHPPLNDTKRAFCSSQNVKIMVPKSYLERNRNMINAMKNVDDILIATPETNEEILRSGTWATIRYAKKQNKKIIIIFPNGQIKFDKINFEVK